MFGDPPSMVVTRRSSRFRAFRAAVPAFARGTRFHGFARSCSNVLLGVGALSALAIVGVALLGTARPAWWREAFPSAAAEVRTERARKVDNNSWSLATQVRPMAAADTRSGKAVQSEPWSVSLSTDSATAWLNEKLPQWLSAQEHPVTLPPGTEMQAAFEAGLVRLGLCLPKGGPGGSRQYVSLALRPRVDEKGLWLPAETASLGRLDLPVAAVLPRRTREGEEAQAVGAKPAMAAFSPELAAVLRGEAPALAEAMVRLPDGRRVRLLKFEAVSDRLVLTFRTEAGK